ncbi:hypothetical protein ABI59_19915 [Acidobacteria bacterium Mor1]|nr:hypothetical protein ABI59_19915 [Acidobacteria bacterium Mor1]
MRKLIHGACFVLLCLAGVPGISAQTQIDWTGVAGNGSYSGTTAGVGWSLTVSSADSVQADSADPRLLRGRVGNPNGSAIYEIEFDRPVHVVFWNDASGTVGGLAGLSGSQEQVDLVAASGDYSYVDNSINIAAPPNAAAKPVFGQTGSDLTASAVAGVDHAYYLARSIGAKTRLTWRHSNVTPKLEAWRVAIAPTIDWTGVVANGTYTGTVDGVGWTLTVSGADSVQADSADPTMLRGVVGDTSQTATYELVFDHPVSIVWANATNATVGGLAGIGTSDEQVEIVGGSGSYTLGSNAPNVAAAPNATLPPVLSNPGNNLRASSAPGQDHAYYKAQSITPQVALRWTHSNTVRKAELWRMCISACRRIEWGNIAGDGAYNGTQDNFSWTLNIQNADSASVSPSEPAVLRGRIGDPNPSATYNMTISPAADLVWYNVHSGTLGGLAGAGISNEGVSLTGGAPNYSLLDNASNIVNPPASAASPLLSQIGNNLHADASPNVDHAYYLARSTSPQTSLDWVHTNNTAKLEGWSVCPSCPARSGTPSLFVDRVDGEVLVRWLPVAGASSYDLVYGSLTELRGSGGDFELATLDCVAEKTQLESPVTLKPPPGETYWYLARAVFCQGVGTFDSTGFRQQGPRDPGIGFSGNDCP